MKMKLRDAVFLYETLSRLAEMEAMTNAPIEIKFTLVRNARAVQPFYSEFMEQRRELLIANSSPKDKENEESGERTATSTQIKFINAELDKLGEVEIEIPIIPVILKDLESLNIDMAGLSGLYPIIADGKV